MKIIKNNIKNYLSNGINEYKLKIKKKIITSKI